MPRKAKTSSPGETALTAGEKKSARKRAGTRNAATSARAKSLSRTEVSDAEVRLRAYFIAEYRAQNAIGGDASSDWIEARRQLLADG